MDVHELLVAQKGTFCLNGPATYSGKISAFFTTSETQVTELEINGSDVLADYISATGSPIDGGTLLRPTQPQGSFKKTWTVFSKITITSGKGTIFKG